MPTVEVRSYTGETFRIDSKNPVTLAMWLVETLMPLASASAAMDSCQVRIWPRAIATLDNGRPQYDWPLTEAYTWSPEQMEVLVDRFRELIHNANEAAAQERPHPRRRANAR